MHADLHTHTHTHTHTGTHAYARTHKPMYADLQVTQTHTHTDTHIHTYMPVCRYARQHVHINKHPQNHTLTHTHTDKHIHRTHIDSINTYTKQTHTLNIPWHTH